MRHEVHRAECQRPRTSLEDIMIIMVGKVSEETKFNTKDGPVVEMDGFQLPF
jgi:hypothetical protein